MSQRVVARGTGAPRPVAARIVAGGLLAGALLLGVGPVPASAATPPAAGASGLTVAAVSARQDRAGLVVVTWRLAGTDRRLTGFRVERVGTGAGVLVAAPGRSARAVVDDLGDLGAGPGRFEYVVTAVGGGVDLARGDVYTTAIFAHVPGPPRAIHATTGPAAGGVTVTVSWHPPAVNPRLLTGYLVQRLAPGGSWTVVARGIRARRLVDRIAGLATGTGDVDYVITSLAGPAGGGAVTLDVPVAVGVPDPPGRVTAHPVFFALFAGVAWTAPVGGAGPVTGYRVTRSVDGGPDALLAAVGPGVRGYLDVTLWGLAEGDTVRYTVTSVGPGSVPGGARSASFVVRRGSDAT
jgi:hypothetical protein